MFGRDFASKGYTDHELFKLCFQPFTDSPFEQVASAISRVPVLVLTLLCHGIKASGAHLCMLSCFFPLEVAQAPQKEGNMRGLNGYYSYLLLSSGHKLVVRCPTSP